MSHLVACKAACEAADTRCRNEGRHFLSACWALHLCRCWSCYVHYCRPKEQSTEEAEATVTASEADGSIERVDYINQIPREIHQIQHAFVQTPPLLFVSTNRGRTKDDQTLCTPVRVLETYKFLVNYLPSDEYVNSKEWYSNLPRGSPLTATMNYWSPLARLLQTWSKERG